MAHRPRRSSGRTSRPRRPALLPFGLVAALLAGLVAVIGQAAPAQAASADGSYGWAYYNSLGTTSNPDWMRTVPDDTPLAFMSIPGTHDTMAYYGGDLATAQEWFPPDSQTGLTQQLNSGIRALDLRVYPNGTDPDDKLWLYHGIAGQHHALGEGVLDPLTKWLAAHPSETVLVSFKKEGGSCGDDAAAEMDAELRKYTEKVAYKQYFWGPSVPRPDGTPRPAPPRIGDVRGKIVVNTFRGACGGTINGWGLNSGNSERLVEDAYEFTVSDAKWKWDRVRTKIEVASEDTDPDHLYYTWLNGAGDPGSGLAGGFPYQTAGGWRGYWGVNHWAYDYFDHADIAYNTGVLMMDYPGGGLVAQIINRNPGQDGRPVPVGWKSQDRRSFATSDDRTVRSRFSGRCVEVDPADGDGRRDGGRVRQQGCGQGTQQQWSFDDRSRMVNGHSGKCLDADVSNGRIRQWSCGDGKNQQWTFAGTWLRNAATGQCLTVFDAYDDSEFVLSACAGNDTDHPGTPANPVTPPPGRDPTAAGDPVDTSPDDRGTKPAASGDCRPDGLTPVPGTSPRYCDVYDGEGREWLGNGRSRRVVGYFTGWRTGGNGEARYLVKNIPWSKVSHINYAFAHVDPSHRIAVGPEATSFTWPGVAGAEMDASLPYRGHFNLLTRYKRAHPAVKTLISVGGWAETAGFYRMATNADGSVNQAGIDTFADSVVDFLGRYGFNGVDIDYEYPSKLPQTGNPTDWSQITDAQRKGLPDGYNALMRTLRAKLDRAGSAQGRYYLLTSAASGSGYLVRGTDAQPALRYQDFVNVMTYDLHGSWNDYVGPQAPLYDDGRDAELANATGGSVYGTPEFGKTGYFNTDWAYHYYRGALQPGRINLGIPYYTRGWRNVSGGVGAGLWGGAKGDQSRCLPGTGLGGQACGDGATGVDNIWHDRDAYGQEVPAGSNPMWHAKNLQDGKAPAYLWNYGIDPAAPRAGSYERHYDDTLKAPWLWNGTTRTFLSTEDEQSVDAKAAYVADRGIGGVMVWELAGDYTRRDSGEWGIGYDLTTRLDTALRGAGAYGAERAGATALPRQVLDVTAELVDYGTDLYPLQPRLRITNKSGQPLIQGTEIALDLPTSTSALVKDGSWQELKGLTAGHTGSNAGGLKGDFHRLTLKLGYCEDIPAGRSKDIDVKYYLPITGPANVTFKVGGQEYGSTGDARRGVSVIDPPAPADGTACQAAPWSRHAYNPNPSFAFWRTGDKWIIEDRNSGNVLDHPGGWGDAHLVDKQDGNQNQLWDVREDGGAGWYRITSASSGHDQCLGATTARSALTVRDCDGGVDQWWRLAPLSTDPATAGRPLLDRTVSGGPVHGTAYGLAAYADGDDWWAAPAYLAAPEDSGTSPGTRIVAGDTTGAWASTVSWNGFYWRAKWWNRADDEPGASDAWQQLGPTP
ncbi:phosphatidylinositol-specific phospholipase C domain-containing protein [Streptomyces sp. NPDC101160]|uniref:phosphatidylinositol-specific phospholipase C domain-containing protein n=1 Tax=Streptomyces sp. NPDC101160 TaxID=3366118 RepID=UPI0037FBEBF8